MLCFKGTSEEWRIVFIVTAVFYALGGLPFLLFARGEVEKWAVVEHGHSTVSEFTTDASLKQPLNFSTTIDEEHKNDDQSSLSSNSATNA